MSRLLVGASVIVLVVPPCAASAAPNIQRLSFGYELTEVSTFDEAAKLHERIASFAEAKCRSISTPPMLNPRREHCAKQLADQLVEQINSPLLSSVAQRSVALASAKQ
jgi:UrcA family protein